MLSAMGERLEHAQPLFLLGAARSGTTVLAKILNSHPRVLMTDETAVFLLLAGVIEKARVGVREGLWYGKTYNQQWAELLKEQARPLVRKFYERIAKEEGKTQLAFWGDKHPHYAACLDFIHELFPQARYVFLRRDPRDVAVSIARMNNWPLAEGIRAAEEFYRLYREFFDRHPELPVFHLRYEELVRDYAHAAGEVFHWLGLETTAEVEQFLALKARRDAHTPMREEDPEQDFSRSVGRFHQVFSEEDHALAEEVLGPYVRQLRY